MRNAASFLLIVFAQVMCAQELPSVKDKAKGYVNTLAGAAMYGRGYVKGGDSLAAEWIAQQFGRIGLEPLNKQRFEPFSFPVNTFPDSVRVSVDGKSLVPGVDFITDPASGSANGHYELVHLTTADMFPPERRAMTMGVISGHAVYLDFPITTNRDTLTLYAMIEEEVVRFAPVLRKAQGKLTWSVEGEQKRNAVIEVKPEFISDSAATVDLRVRPKLIAKSNCPSSSFSFATRDSPW